MAAGLNTVLDGSPLCIAENGGELIVPHPMFRFVATANTNGGGDDTGLYQGAQRQNLAWLDRFMLCEVGYPKPEVEKALLAQRFPLLPEDLSHKLVDFAGEVRKLFMGEADSGNLTSMTGAIEVTLSTRTLLRWAELTVRFQPLSHQGIQPVTYALDRALGYRASRETRAMLHELAQRVFPQNWSQNWPQSEDFSASYATLASESDDITTVQQGLSPLLGADLSTIATPPFVHLDSASTSGGKFWGATATTQGLSITWGRSGATGQRTTIDVAQCANRDPIVEPHVVPVADIIHMALSRVPRKGNITGAELLTLQGLVCLLRDTPALMAHAQKVISGYGPATVLDALLTDAQNLMASAPSNSANEVDESDGLDTTDDTPDFAPLPAMPTPAHIPSMGLW